MIRVLTPQEAENTKTIRCYPCGGDFRQITADWCDSSKGCGGVFIKTDAPMAFSTGRPVPKKVLEALTNGQALVLARGSDYDYDFDSIRDALCEKVVLEKDGYWSFDGFWEEDSITPYHEPIIFRHGVDIGTLLRVWKIGDLLVELHSDWKWGRTPKPLGWSGQLLNLGFLCINKE